jgi:hypothetical protein
VPRTDKIGSLAGGAELAAGGRDIRPPTHCAPPAGTSDLPLTVLLQPGHQTSHSLCSSSRDIRPPTHCAPPSRTSDLTALLLQGHQTAHSQLRPSFVPLARLNGPRYLTLSNISCAPPSVLRQNSHNTVKLRRRLPPAARRQNLTAQFCPL